MNLPARIAHLADIAFGTSPVLSWTVVVCIAVTVGCLAVGLLARRR